MTLTQEILSQLPGDVFSDLKKADSFWQQLRYGNTHFNEIIKTCNESLPNMDFDVCICGGTLGILMATTLQLQGWKVAIIERGILRGRDQEWNISRQELQVFMELNLLSEREIEEVIYSEYNPARVSFHQGYELWVKDVLNIGVSPFLLLEKLKTKFINLGGVLLENTNFQGAIIYNNGVKLQIGENKITSCLLIDAMGHFSPISKQVRKGEKPEGVCLVVGSCGKGYEKNDKGDLIASFTPILNDCQYFWEAFPAKEGRTTYLFTYLDADPNRFNLEFFAEEYFKYLPQYQNIELDKLQFQRFLFGFFPAYKTSPLKMPFNRILPLGDSSGSQSPVSFGGFGSMVRHLKRLSLGINEALNLDLLNSKDLSLLQPYQPNISVTWLFQKTMSVKIGQKYDPNQINNLMSAVFSVMDNLGNEVLKPFLQDVIQFGSLSKTLPLVNPKFVLPLLPQVGIPVLIDWLIHYVNLGLYSGLYPLANTLKPVTKNLSPEQKYYYHRFLDSWKYGSGNDYHG